MARSLLGWRRRWPPHSAHAPRARESRLSSLVPAAVVLLVAALALMTLFRGHAQVTGRSAHRAVLAAPVARGQMAGQTALNLPATRSSLYWGASIGPQFSGHQAPWDTTAIAAFRAMVGKGASIISFGTPFSDCSVSPCSPYSFPTTPLTNIRAGGAIPLLSWSSQSIPAAGSEPDYSLATIISGRHDGYIRAFARGAKAWGHPFFMRFDWEMNGTWFPWSESLNGNRPGQYVAAWRHVHAIFAAVGATRVSWVWCPIVDPGRIWTNLSELYPGDSYVDWTCLDGYNYGLNPIHPDRWTSFDDLYRSTYHEIVGTVAPSKPMLIGEVASTEEGGSKAEWISSMLSELPSAYPQIHGFVWFERRTSGLDWPLESSAPAATAFARGIKNQAYQANHFANLKRSPIPTP